MIQYAPGTKVQVRVNDAPIAPNTPTQTETNATNTVTTQVWYDLPLESGENRITIQPEGGTPVSVSVTVKSSVARLEFLPASDPRVPADGRSTVAVEGQILDADGNPVPDDVIVTLTSSAGKFVGADQDRDRPGFQVFAQGGRFTAQLQSTLAPQLVRVRAAVSVEARQNASREFPPVAPIQRDANGRSTTIVPTPTLPTPNLPLTTTPLEAYTQVEFITNLRPFIISGTVNFRLGAGGSDFYGSFRDFLAPGQSGTRFDVTTALFATGRIGSWLFTGAFNNQRPLNQVCDGSTRLFRDPQFCDQVYPVYGDSSTTDYLTPSIDSVYLKLERTSPVLGAGTDYFMWGDYSTPEFATSSQVFTATNRQLHGFKGNFNFGNLQISALYGNNLEAFQRDTIAPNGTSGYYFLSQRLVLGGSEQVFLETEELQRPGTVIDRKQLFRGTDYEIDYDRGTLMFRRPILQTDLDLFGRSLVRRIVVTYQYGEENTGDGNLYAGRLQYNLSREPGRESWLGASYLNEDQNARTFELYGVDALISLGKEARLVAEFARSNYDSLFRNTIRGNAYRLEAYGPLLGNALLGRAYYRSVDENFVNNSTFSYTPGQTRYGAELAAKLGDTTSFQVQFDREINFGISTGRLRDVFNPGQDPQPGSRVDNSVTTLRAGITQKFGAADLSVDYVNRSRQDRATDRLDEDSNQIVTRLNLPITQRLTFRAQNETNLGSGGDPLYPDRTTFGLDWAVMPGMTVRLAQQFYGGNWQLSSKSITSLDTVFDQQLSEDTTITGRYSLLNGVNGLTSQGAIGLNHRIVLAPGLKLNLAYERIFGDIFAYTAAGEQISQPYAVGQSAASLGVSSGNSYSVGVEYTDNPNFKASARLEYRDSRVGDSFVISAAAAGKLSPAFTVLGRYQQANFANQRIDGLGDTINIKVGLAYRNPVDDKFNALLRYEYRQNPSTIPDDLELASGTGANIHLLALEALYAPNYRWEFYGKIALRDARSYLAKDLIGTNTITLSQFRTNYRFGYRWDVGGEVRWIHQTNTGYNEFGFVADLGYYLTPNLRLAAGYSFGKARDRDFGDRDRGGPFINLTLKLNELFNGFGLQKVAPPQQQESVVQPVAASPASVPAPTPAVEQPIPSTIPHSPPAPESLSPTNP